MIYYLTGDVKGFCACLDKETQTPQIAKNTPEDMELTDEPKKNEEEHIVFENVSFSYKNKSVKNIDNISF